MTQLSATLSRVKPSATVAMTAKAAELKRAGHDIISLGAGEPDFDTPDPIKAAAIRAIEAGETKYTPVDGIAEQREVVIKGLEQNYQKIPGIAAATILGDGKIALIVDTDQMIAPPSQGGWDRAWPVSTGDARHA